MQRTRKAEILIVLLAVLLAGPVAMLRLLSLQVEARAHSRMQELRTAAAAIAGSMRVRCAARLLVGDLDREALARELTAAAHDVPRLAECALLDGEFRLLAAVGRRGANARAAGTFTTEDLRRELGGSAGKRGPVVFADADADHYAAAAYVEAGAATYVLVATMPAVSPTREAGRSLAPCAATAVLLALLGALAALVVSRAVGRGLTRTGREGR